ncbi:Plasma membrane sulfite pump involved in sulfite metabolism [Rhodotorula toruloides]|uniref:RHTO0S14e03664g1_1 n=2 Tax=Rhodotorula toruloides TaxID=5286 RepID=A0A061BHR4_RHOTO|nr:sulphite efflux pump protein [Rhodotorula toruloides NP11]EMS24867.1 sulphite efflux pump protein [Rhodotorula toruloides NP11]CDR47435.1 RHTO0S14e03664g1_1 [Rhodotorula toruloides]
MTHSQPRLPAAPQRAVTRAPDSAEATLIGRTSSSNTAAQTESGSVEKEISRGSMGHHPLFADKARGIRLRALRFTASWYSVTMGTGIVNTLLFDLPWENAHPTFRAIGSAFLIFDMVLFLAFSILTVTRYTLYPKIFMAMLQHETHSLFLGCIPMGFVTIISGIAATGHEYGLPTLDAALVLYWSSVGMSMLTAFGIPFVMFTQHKHTSETLTAAWLLPIVPLITEAAVGSTLCKLLLLQNRHTYCLTLLIASYLCAGIGMLLAAAVIVLYLQRLLLHHLPPREVIVSSWLPVGPIGQGGFALIELGQVATKLFPLIASPSRPALDFLGPAMLGSAVLTGLLLWGLGIWFAFLAIVSIAAQFRRSGTEGAGTAVFNMGWWAFTFPLGSLTLLTFSLATVFDSMFFKVCSTIMTFSVFSLWCIVFVPTCIGFFRGTLFAAPCLQALPKEYVDRLAPAEGGPKLRKEEQQAQASA